MCMNPMMNLNAHSEIEYVSDLILSYSNSILCSDASNRFNTSETLKSLEAFYLKFLKLNQFRFLGVKLNWAKAMYLEMTTLAYEYNQCQIKEQTFLLRLDVWRINFLSHRI
jgi:hypothetical protein